MNNKTGFARVLTLAFVQNQANKRLLGKPFLKLGQCQAIWGFAFQTGGLLASHYRDRLDAFGLAFLGYGGEPGAIANYFGQISTAILESGLIERDHSTVHDYVQKDYMKRFGIQGDWIAHLMQHGLDKVPLDGAQALAWGFAEEGSAVGATEPELFKSMFQRTFAPRPHEEIQRALDAGLDIDPENMNISYEEALNGVNLDFVAFVQEYAKPELRVALLGS